MRAVRSTLVQNVGALALLQVATYIAPLLTIPYLTRVLGPQAFGLAAFVQVVMIWFVLLVNYGYPWSATRDIAAHRNDPDYVSRKFSANWTVQWLLTAFGAILLLGIVLLVPALRSDLPVYLAGYTIVIGTALFPVWLMQGLERLREVAAIQVASRVALLLLVFAFVRGPEDVAMAVLAQGMGGIVAGLLCLWWIRRHEIARFTRPTLTQIVQAAREGGHIFISRIAVSLYTVFIPTALGIVGGAAAVGQYSVADRMRTAAQSLMTPISQALFPRMSFLFGTQDIANARRLVRYSLLATVLVSGSASIAMFLLADWIVLIMAGPEFTAAAEVLRWLSPVPFCIGLSNLFGVQIMLPRGQVRAFNIILISAAALGVSLIFPLALWHGAQGAAMTVLFVEAWVTVFMAVYLARNGLFETKASR